MTIILSHHVTLPISTIEDRYATDNGEVFGRLWCTNPSWRLTLIEPIVIIGHDQPQQSMVQRMLEPHKRPYRHPKYKTAYRIKNWREYERALRNRGALTLWMSPAAISAWRAPMTGTRGRMVEK
jgi:hypothetical protein